MPIGEVDLLVVIVMRILIEEINAVYAPTLMAIIEVLLMTNRARLEFCKKLIK